MALKIDHSAVKGPGGRPDTSAVCDPVVDAILERMRRQPRRDPAHIERVLREIGEECSKLPVLDNRAADEILGYGDDGLPH